MRTAYDYSPLYRSVIGVDRMSDLIEAATRTGGDTHGVLSIDLRGKSLKR